MLLGDGGILSSYLLTTYSTPRKARAVAVETSTSRTMDRGCFVLVCNVSRGRLLNQPSLTANNGPQPPGVM